MAGYKITVEPLAGGAAGALPQVFVVVNGTTYQGSLAQVTGGSGGSTGGGTGTGGGTTPTLISPAYYVAASRRRGRQRRHRVGSLRHARQRRRRGAGQFVSTKAVYLRGGTYTLGAALSLTSADNGLTLAGYPGEVAVIDGNSGPNNLIVLDGCTGATIQSVQMQRIKRTPSGADFNSILLLRNGANNNKVLGCRITAGDVGMLLVGSSYNQVAGCVFDTWRIAGVEFKDLADHNTFDSNSCDGTGSTNDNNETSGGAFYGHGVNYNTISHNLIQECPGTGISIANFDGPAQPIYTINVGNVVSYNRILNCGKLGADTGSIYTVGRAQVDTKMIIEYNYVDGARNLTTANQHILGIYIDDEANGVTVRNNIMRNVQDNCMQYHGGRDNIVYNNIFDMGSGDCTATLFQGKTYAPSTETMTNNVLRNNIMYSTGSNPTVIKDFDGGGKVIQNNLYYCTTGASMANNQDASPVYGNPRFTNAAGGDYSLLSGSAASNISFTAIDQSLIGLKPTTVHWY